MICLFLNFLPRMLRSARFCCRLGFTLLVFTSAVMAANVACAATYTAQPDQLNLRIPPIGTGGSGDSTQDVTKSTITVSGLGTNLHLEYLKVNLSLDHTYDGDLVITLLAPDGTPIPLANRAGGGAVATLRLP